MTPFFSPGPHDYPHIPIYIAGVNRRMCRLAGELCEGFHVHPLHTRRYLQEVICQNIELGLTQGGRQREDIELSASIFVIPTLERAKNMAEIEHGFVQGTIHALFVSRLPSPFLDGDPNAGRFSPIPLLRKNDT